MTIKMDDFFKQVMQQHEENERNIRYGIFSHWFLAVPLLMLSFGMLFGVWASVATLGVAMFMSTWAKLYNS